MLRAAVVWGVLIIVAILNGGFRVAVLNPQLNGTTRRNAAQALFLRPCFCGVRSPSLNLPFAKQRPQFV